MHQEGGVQGPSSLLGETTEEHKSGVDCQGHQDSPPQACTNLWGNSFRRITSTRHSLYPFPESLKHCLTVLKDDPQGTEA